VGVAVVIECLLVDDVVVRDAGSDVARARRGCPAPGLR